MPQIYTPDEQKAIVQRMIDAGESEDNIATVIQHFQTAPAAPAVSVGSPAFRLPEQYAVPPAVGRRQMATSLVNALPAAGGVVGGLVTANPVGVAAGAALGGFAGEKVKQLINASTGLQSVAPTEGERTIQAAKQGVIQGVANGVGQLLSAAVSKGATWAGQQIETRLMKPTAVDVRNGFQVQNVFKHGLGGTLRQSLDKSGTALDGLKDQLDTVLKANPGAQVDVIGALADTAKDLAKTSPRTIGTNASIERAVNVFLDDPVFQQLPDGTADLLTATEIKRGVGELGAWVHDPTGATRTADSKALETVANTFYQKLKGQIEQQAVGPVAQINRQMSEIIPIRQALIRRIPVAERANILNLSDLAGWASGHPAISFANRLLRSGQMANILVTGAPAMGRAAQAGALAAGAAASQSEP